MSRIYSIADVVVYPARLLADAGGSTPTNLTLSGGKKA
jgi:hypothetical protein